MSRRSRAREVVLQVLYQDDLNPPVDPAESDAFLRKRLHDDPPLVAFAAALLAGVRSRRDELDGLLAQRADNWSLGRMAATDRNVLRLGAFEILFTETPGRVAINEAVELAKRFGAKQSPQFVNGILDRFLQKEDKTTERAKRAPSAEEYARALRTIAEKPAEWKFPAYCRTLLKTHHEAGPQAAAELAEAMGWDDGATVLARYGDLGRRLSEELHFDPPLYDAAGVPLWISVLAVRHDPAERVSETSRWELRGELAEALEILGWE